MIKVTTIQGAKEILKQYSGGEYCVIYMNLPKRFEYSLVPIKKLAEFEVAPTIFDFCEPPMEVLRVWLSVAQIPEFIMLELIDQGYVVKDMSEEERRVQEALGTAPT